MQMQTSCLHPHVVLFLLKFLFVDKQNNYAIEAFKVVEISISFNHL